MHFDSYQELSTDYFLIGFVHIARVALEARGKVQTFLHPPMA